MWNVEDALKNVKVKSSPGNSLIGYFHLRSAFEANPCFFTSMVTRIINNEDFDDIFCSMKVVPVFKTAKRLPPDNCKAFRAICCGETLFKCCEFIFVAKIRSILEKRLSDFQHA